MVDSTSGLTDWTRSGEFREWSKDGPCQVRTVGFLARRTKKALTVVQSAIREGRQTHSAMIIPRGCVKKVRKLK